jgi:hypothetical protein
LKSRGTQAALSPLLTRVPMHAFVDESLRGGRYLMCAVLVAPAHLAEARQALLALRMPGQRRLHMKTEHDRRRRLILDRIAALPVRANLYRRAGRPTAAREACLRAMTADLLTAGVTRLVIEPIQTLVHPDRIVLINEMQRLKRPGAFVYEHLAAPLEPNLWAADAIAWAYGSGGDWRRRIQNLVDIHPGQREPRILVVRPRPGATS